MNLDRQLAIDYLRAPPSGLWRWADEGTVVVWHDGSTIAFREELVPMLEWLRPQGLPSFGLLILLLAALRGKLPMATPFLRTPPGSWPAAARAQVAVLDRARPQFAVQLEAALAELRKLAQLPSELQSGVTAECVLAGGLPRHARSERHMAAGTVLRGWSEVIPDGVLNELLPGAVWNEVRHIHVLAEGLKAHSAESLALRLRTGLDALPGGTGPDLPPSERARSL